MPEGHTIHRLARDHQKWFAGESLSVSSPQGRFAEQAAELSGKKLTQVAAHGKHLFYHWGRGPITHVHLGLYGKFRVFKLPAPEPRGAVRMRCVGSERGFDLNGPNCCELITRRKFTEISSRLGEDPLQVDARVDNVWSKICKSRSSIGSVLLNQSIIAGVGNVYRAEILFLTRIHPNHLANRLTREKFDELWSTTVRLMKIGVKYNRIITTIDNHDRPPSRLRKGERLNVYKASYCPQCAAEIECWVLANRKMYACGICQQVGE